MENEVQELFDDYDSFARQSANVQLSNLAFDVYEFRDDSAMQVDLLFIKKLSLKILRRHFLQYLKSNCLMEKNGITVMNQVLQIINGSQH